MAKRMSYYVEIREYETDRLEKRLGPMSERKADKVDDGLTRQLDHDRFYTVIVNEDEAGEV